MRWRRQRYGDRLSGASIAETVAGGYGTLSINMSGICTVGSLSAGCAAGTYVRAGVIEVIVAPTCVVAGQASASAIVVPVALFEPEQTPPALIWTAGLAGIWALASV
jgi:hypothetical protein